MSGTTTRLALPYPALTDGPDGADVPHWIQALANALDVAAIDDQGVLASRPVSTSGSPGIKGRYYMVKGDPDTTQNGILYRDNGTGWDAVNIILPGTVTSADLAAGAVTTAAIAAGAVGATQIASGGVGTAQIAAGAVTASLVANALKPSAGAADGTEALRAIGSGAGQVVAGNDSRLAIISNSSTGTAGSAVVLAASPALTGTPTAPTPSTADNTTKIATTAYVQNQGYAFLASPTFTGTPTAPTPVSSDNSTKLATTAYVKAQGYTTLASPAFTGTPTAPTAATGDNSTTLATTAFVKAQGYTTDALVVHLANTETVTGIKAFSAGPRWSTQSVSGTATLVDGSASVVLADTTTAAFTLTLPAAPGAGSWFRIVDAAAQFATHNLTVARNGKNIDGAAANVVLNANNSVLELYYDGTGWRTTETGVFAGGDLTGSYPSPTIKASVALTGTPTAPTATVDTNTTQLATTAFVIGQAASATPLAAGVAAVGTSTRYARADHVHPSVGAVTYRSTAAVDPTNTVAETDLLNGSITIAANALGANGVVRLTAFGDWLQNSGASRDVPRFKLKLGATTLLDTGVTGQSAITASATRKGWKIVCEIMNLGATNSQWATMTGDLTVSGFGATAASASFTTGEGSINSQTGSVQVSYRGENAGAVDTTAAQALVLSVILPTATATIDLACKGALVEVI